MSVSLDISKKQKCTICNCLDKHGVQKYNRTLFRMKGEIILVKNRQSHILAFLLIFVLLTASLLCPYGMEWHIKTHWGNDHDDRICLICLQFQLYRAAFVLSCCFFCLLAIKNTVISVGVLCAPIIQSPIQLKVRMNN